MKNLLQICLSLIVVSSLCAQDVSENEVIQRARATVGTDEALDNLITLQLICSLEPVDSEMPSATLVVIARKPLSQRLEIKVDDIVETTILDGDRGCIVRSNLTAGASQMRDLIGPELERVRYSTRQYFNYYRPDAKHGETVRLVGRESYRDQRCYKLVYEYPEGLQTIRYFSILDDALVSTISASGVESISVGSQTVAGIKFPQEIEYYEGGRKLHTIVVHEVKVNKPLTSGIFDIPHGESH
jgi:hypothetical protein